MRPPKLKNVRLVRFGQAETGDLAAPVPAGKPEVARPAPPKAAPPPVQPDTGHQPEPSTVPRPAAGRAAAAVTPHPEKPIARAPEATPPAALPKLSDEPFFQEGAADPSLRQLPAPPATGQRRALLLGVLAGAAATLALGFAVWIFLRPAVGETDATGILLVESDRRAVQHPDGGYVEQVFVRDGDRVAAGDRLVLLDPARLSAQLEPLRARTTALRALVTRLEAEQAGRLDMRADAEDGALAAALAAQRELLRSRRSALDGQVSVLQQRARQLREQIAGMAAQDQSRTRQIQMLYLQRDGLGDPQRAGGGARARLLALERDIARLDGDRGDHAAAVARLGVAAGETDMQVLQLRRGFAEEAGIALDRARTALAEAQGQLASLQERLRRLDVRAPVPGVVGGLAANAAGTAIAPGQEILQITPAPDRIFVEADLRPAAVARLSAGAAAIIELGGRQATARLVRVATEHTIDAATGFPVYRARFALDEGGLAGRPVVPGMPVRVTVGTRLP